MGGGASTKSPTSSNNEISQSQEQDFSTNSAKIYDVDDQQVEPVVNPTIFSNPKVSNSTSPPQAFEPTYEEEQQQEFQHQHQQPHHHHHHPELEKNLETSTTVV